MTDEQEKQKGDAEVSKINIDLGDGHTLRWVSWKPDRALNPQFADLPDDERCGAIVTHLLSNGALCSSYIGLNPAINTDSACWKIEQWEPLTLSPSLLCRTCGDHGFIREGKWVRA